MGGMRLTPEPCGAWVRSVISFQAGMNGTDLGLFGLFTFLGATVWNTVLVSPGYILREYWIAFAKGLDGVGRGHHNRARRGVHRACCVQSTEGTQQNSL